MGPVFFGWCLKVMTKVVVLSDLCKFFCGFAKFAVLLKKMEKDGKRIWGDLSNRKLSGNELR